MQTDPRSALPVSKEFIRELERRRLRSLIDADMDLARELHADDYELVPPGGGPVSGSEYLGSIARGEFRYDAFEPASDIRVRTYRDVAVIRYLARIEARGEGWRDAGHFWHTDLYEFRYGRWQAVWSQATRARDDPR